MPADVVCMSLGSVPTGEQRSRFLAVGLSDNTVRIISLDPTVSPSIILFNSLLKIFNALMVLLGLLVTIEYASFTCETRISLHC